MTAENETGVKNYFKSNNALIFYELKTPIIHDLQDINIRTFNNSTIISIDSPIKPEDGDFSFETQSNLSNVLNTAINKVNLLEKAVYNNNQANLTLSLNSLNNDYTLSNIINEGL
ncbi:hypothetical protein [Paraclostridium dentum]|uniref:hypothetical protein n=1 Tax=Paraclostridium dentum TaxID=2662455 RepID=UPI003F343BB2